MHMPNSIRLDRPLSYAFVAMSAQCVHTAVAGLASVGPIGDSETYQGLTCKIFPWTPRLDLKPRIEPTS